MIATPDDPTCIDCGVLPPVPRSSICLPCARSATLTLDQLTRADPTFNARDAALAELRAEHARALAVEHARAR